VYAEFTLLQLLLVEEQRQAHSRLHELQELLRDQVPVMSRGRPDLLFITDEKVISDSRRYI
jgi:hypothetical protein